MHAAWISAVAAIGAGLLLATLLEVDKVVRAEGQLRAVDKSAQIVAPVSGRIHGVHVSEGDMVRKGARLITIEPDASGLSAQQARVDMVRHAAAYDAYTGSRPLLQTQGPAEAAAYALVRRGARADLRAARTHVAIVAAELEEGRAQLEVERAALRRLESLEPIVRERLSRHVELVSSGFQSPVSLLTFRQEAVDVQEQIFTGRSRLSRADAEVRRRSVALQAARTELDRLEAARAAEAYTQWQLAEAEFRRWSELGRNSIVESPVDGVVEHVAVQVAGNAVRSGERLMSIVPVGGPMEVHLRVRNEDYPFVVPGQAVTLKFDAYPFTIYGSRAGVVERLMREILPADGGSANYVVVVRLQPAPKDGSALDIRHGMKLVADIEVGKQRPIDIWLDPFVRFASEALRERR